MAIIDKIHSLISGSSSEYVLKDNSGTQSSHKHTKDQITDFPTIPAAANNGTLTIQKNGTNVAQFGADSASDVTANISVPTALSELSTDTTHRVVTDIEKSTWNNKAPTNHASTATTYGVGDATNYGHVKVDSALSTTSTNPVQNKVVKAALDGKADKSTVGDFRTKSQHISMGANLVVNGNGRNGDNYNFTSFKRYPTIVTNGAACSFGFNGCGWDDEYISCDFTKKILFSVDIKNLAVQPVMPTHRIYVEEYDIDKNIVQAINVMYGVGTLTELTQDLKPGDTVVHLQDLSNSNWKSATTYHRGFIFWNYKNSFGYQYEPETYSRNVYPSSDSNYLWEVANVDQVNNVITLNSPWSGPLISAGTKVSRRSSGSTYPYPATESFNDLNWHHLVGTMNGVASVGTSERTTKFSQGVVYFRVGVFPSNLSVAPTTDDRRAVLANLMVYELPDVSNGINGTLPIANGGTGATTASAARTNLGLGTMATKNNVSDGDINGTISDSHIASASTWNGKYTKPSGGIPKSDLASAVQTSLGLADTALQQHQSLEGYVNNIQADSTTTFGNDTTIVVGKSGKNILTRTALALYNYIKGKLATVASSGSYNDLSNKPTIPAAANNGKLTIRMNGASKGDFTANASADKTIDLGTVITDVSGKLNTDGSNATATTALNILNAAEDGSTPEDAVEFLAKNASGTRSLRYSLSELYNVYLKGKEYAYATEQYNPGKGFTTQGSLSEGNALAISFPSTHQYGSNQIFRIQAVNNANWPVILSIGFSYDTNGHFSNTKVVVEYCGGYNSSNHKPVVKYSDTLHKMYINFSNASMTRKWYLENSGGINLTSLSFSSVSKSSSEFSNATEVTSVEVGVNIESADHGSSVGSSSQPVYVNADGYVQPCTSVNAATANNVNFGHANEINFSNVPTSGNKHRVWLNYRNGDTGTTDSSNKITEYYFGNRNAETTGVTLIADEFSGNAATATSSVNADKVDGFHISVGGGLPSSPDDTTLYFV